MGHILLLAMTLTFNGSNCTPKCSFLKASFHGRHNGGIWTQFYYGVAVPNYMDVVTCRGGKGAKAEICGIWALSRKGLDFENSISMHFLLLSSPFRTQLSFWSFQDVFGLSWFYHQNDLNQWEKSLVSLSHSHPGELEVNKNGMGYWVCVYMLNPRNQEVSTSLWWGRRTENLSNWEFSYAPILRKILRCQTWFSNPLDKLRRIVEDFVT